MEATIIRKDQREYHEVTSFTKAFSRRVVSQEKGEFRFMLSKIAPHGKVTPHSHKQFQLNMIERGAARMRVDEREYTLYDGDVIVIPGGAVHEMESHTDGDEVSYIEVKWLEV